MKFKNKTTGEVISFSPYDEIDRVIWQEIVLTTADGVEIVDKLEKVYLTSDFDWNEIEMCPAFRAVILLEKYLHFQAWCTEYAAKEYVNEHKPRFSLKDVEYILEQQFKEPITSQLLKKLKGE